MAKSHKQRKYFKSSFRYKTRNSNIVYVLELFSDITGWRFYYVGTTNNLDRRVKQHKTGKGSKICKKYKVKTLISSEICSSNSVAMQKEKELTLFYRTQNNTKAWGANYLRDY